MNQLGLLELFQALVGGTRLVGHLGRLCHEVQAVPGQAPVVGCNAQRDPEQPRPHRALRIEQRHLVVDAHEHFVRQVLEVTLLDAEAPQAVPHVAELLLEDRGCVQRPVR